MKIKVILRENIAEAVLAAERDDPELDVEVIDINKDYEDYQQFNAYADSIYADKAFKQVSFSSAHFDEEDAQ